MELNRRETDKAHLDIEVMILEENDPKQRAFLIVLNSINQSLLANTALTHSVSTKLEEHLENFTEHAEKEEAIMNKGRGAWKVAAWVVGIAQVFAVMLWTDTRTTMITLADAVVGLKITQAEHTSRLDRLEK